jgi:hypothetical protein
MSEVATLRESNMRKLVIYGLIAVIVLALILGIVSFKLSGDNGDQVFWSNLLLNIVAELFGLALGILIPLIIVSKLAGQRLDRLARPLVELIAELRTHNAISATAARNCVICAVRLLSEDHLKQKSISLSIAYKKDNCEVCALRIDTLPDKRCEHCGLLDHVWKLKKETEKG